MTKSNTNKLASWPIPKLLLSMGVPAFFSMFIQSMYNVVDTIYISNYSKDAMYAIGLVTPLFMIGLSIAHKEGLDIHRWFVVIQVTEKHFRLVYENGGYDNLMEDYPKSGYNTDGIAEIYANDYSEIVFLTIEICFDLAKKAYEDEDRDCCIVWRKYDRQEN